MRDIPGTVILSHALALGFVLSATATGAGFAQPPPGSPTVTASNKSSIALVVAESERAVVPTIVLANSAYAVLPGSPPVLVALADRVHLAFGVSQHFLAFTKLDEQGYPRGQLYVRDLATGREAEVLADELVVKAAWRPSTTDLAVLLHTDTGDSTLVLYDLNSAHRLDVASVANLTGDILRWLPDGTSLIATAEDSDDRHLSSSHQSDGLDLLRINDQGQVIAAQSLGHHSLNVVSSQLTPSTEQATEDFGVRAARVHAEPSGSLAINLADGRTVLNGAYPWWSVNEDTIILRTFNGGISYYWVRLDLGSIERLTAPVVPAATATATQYKLPWKKPLVKLVTQGNNTGSTGGSHKGNSTWAYDFGLSGSVHVLAAAGGMVVLVRNDVTCNAGTQACPAWTQACEDDHGGTGVGGVANGGWGNIVVIGHADGTWTKYAHLVANSVRVNIGQIVPQGYYIGDPGHTGSSSGSGATPCGDHLHFQRQEGGERSSNSVPIDFVERASPIAAGTSLTSDNAEAAEGTASFGGIITNASTGGTISGASIVWGSYTDTTDSDGRYLLSFVPCQTATLTVSASGYHTYSQSHTPPCLASSEKNVELTGANMCSAGFYFEGTSATATACGIPTVTTTAQTNVTSTTATFNATINSDGGSAILERRFEWGIYPNWTSATNLNGGVINVSGSNFSYTATGLVPNTNYQFRGWARNALGWADPGNGLRFNTLSSPATRIIRLVGDLAFGNIAVGQTSARTLTIYNDGNSTLNVSGISYPSRFSGNWGSGSISAGGSQAVTVTFAPTSATDYGGTITVSSDKTSGTSTTSCAGAGVTAATRIIRLAGDLTFGSVAVGQTSARTLTIYNDGSSALSVSSISYPSRFSGDWASGSISAGGSQAVSVTFAPTSATSYGGTITVNSDKTSGTNTTSCDGSGVTGATRIIRLAGDLTFGNVAVGQTSARTLTIYNDGSSSLSVSSISYPSGFSGSWSGSISAGGSQGVSVIFAPNSATSYGGTITVSSDKTSGTSTTSCSGDGVGLCTYSTCSTVNVGTGAGSGGCGVTATSGCAWTASSNATSWLTTSSSGNGNGTVSFDFTANTGASRTGIITVQGQTITVNQGTTCTYSLCSPTASVGAGPGSSACSVTTTSNCAWTAISDSPTWLTATGSGNGSGTFSYSYTANTGASRTGTITVQEQALMVTQAGISGCEFTPQGPKLVGTGSVGSAGQGNAVSVSADGNTAIVGGSNDNSSAGAAWIWTRSGGVWTPQGAKLVGAGAVGNAQQGHSVALSADGNTAIVGGKYDNTNVGAAWVWTRSGSAWTPQGKLLASDSVGHSYQGTSVALSADGNTAIVGGYFDNKAGAAWVWTRSGGIWTQQGNKLVAADAVGSAHQGYSVSLSGDGNTAIIGGNYDNYSNGGPGAAWIWTRSGGVWTKQTKLVGSGAVGNAEQGDSVALSGDGNTALVGGSADNNYAGAAWVWTRSGGVWTPQGAKLIGSGAINSAYGPQQGHSVSLSNDGSKALVGGTRDNGDIGAAWVFARTGGVWTTQTKLVGSGAVGTGVYQGRSVSLSGDGNTAIIGGYADNSNVGAAWVFACAESNASPAAPTGVTASAITNTQVEVAWSAVAGATYQIDRQGAGGGFSQIGTSATNSFSDNTASASSAYLYRVRAVKDSIESPSSTADLATTVIFADNPLTAGIVVKAAHLSQLRMAANAVRLLAGLGAASFTDAATGGTAIRGLHITEIRTSLDAALGALGLATSSYTNAPLTGVAVKAVHVQELRSRVQ